MTDLSLQFGEDFKNKHLHLDSSLTFCNHGSYGTCPREIFAKKQKLQLEIETAPDKWFRYTSFNEWTRNKQALVDYLNISYDQLLICDNATDSINSALKSIEFNGSNDAILITEYTYKAIANTVDYIAKYRFDEANQVHVFKVPCVFPIKRKAFFVRFTYLT